MNARPMGEPDETGEGRMPREELPALLERVRALATGVPIPVPALCVDDGYGKSSEDYCQSCAEQVAAELAQEAGEDEGEISVVPTGLCNTDALTPCERCGVPLDMPLDDEGLEYGLARWLGHRTIKAEWEWAELAWLLAYVVGDLDHESYERARDTALLQLARHEAAKGESNG